MKTIKLSILSCLVMLLLSTVLSFGLPSKADARTYVVVGGGPVYGYYGGYGYRRVVWVPAHWNGYRWVPGHYVSIGYTPMRYRYYRPLWW